MVWVRQIQNSSFAVANYLIIDDSANYCWLVDAGDISLIKDAAQGRAIKGVFLTHSHHDHMFGINDLMRSYPYCNIYLSEAGIAMLASDKLNLSKYTGPCISYQGNNLAPFNVKKEYEIFSGVILEAIPTPGHSIDSVTYKLENYLFTGDAYIPGEPVITKLRGGDKTQGIQSKDFILSLINADTILCPGHWGRSKLPF